ncbi:lipopolysaccharide biosynthesis protein [Reinekea sp. G2M2-21]|uniref:lipopolysaccharide biosynthesis protein n=1 Tax=Reinekea sp. G2M2-21 TaxID=2788942 RepID=UPI0018AA2B39|nr:hypothetical protein [Reinekea sp. G2M2-21]
MSKASFNQGVRWLAILSLVAIPVNYLRTWMFSNSISGAELVASFAVLMMITQGAITFLVIGGGASVAKVYVELEEEQQLAFFSSFLVINFLLLVIVLLLISMISSRIDFLSGIGQGYSLFQILVLIFLSSMSAIGIAFQLAQKKYVYFSVLSNLWAYISFFASIILFLGVWENDDFIFYAYVAYGLVSFTVFSWSFRYELKLNTVSFSILWKKREDLVPTYVNSISSYLFLYFDQIIVLSRVGSLQLAAYFLASQIGMLIRYIPDKLALLYMPDFSTDISAKRTDKIVERYHRFGRYVTAYSLVVFCGLLLGADFIPYIFGEWVTGYISIIILFSLASSVSVLGGINSTLIIAAGAARIFLFSNVLLVSIQIIAALLLVSEYGVLGVVLSRVFVAILGQVMNLFIIRRLFLSDFNYGAYYYLFFILIVFVCILELLEIGSPKLICFVLAIISIARLWFLRRSNALS